MDAIQYELLGFQIQLFVQPSISSVYMRNNRQMTNSDFLLSFPAIPMEFGLSSDVASGWSKLVYEQNMIGQRQGQRVEIEIMGLGPSEAHVVEECVKLLFGFKVNVTNVDVWLFLKVSDMLGITQSPLCGESTTVQEQLLSYAKDNVTDINIIEGWDYVLSILESGNDNLPIHRAQIRKLAFENYQAIKDFMKRTKFEILAHYAHDKKSEKKGKFSLKDLKRENYIQMRTLFFDFINKEQSTNLTPTQSVVKVLFDELDSHFELDGYINKYIDNIANKIQGLDQKIIEQQERYNQELYIAKEKSQTECKYLKDRQQELKRELLFMKKKLETIVNLSVETALFHDETLILGLSSGFVEVQDDKGTSVIINQDMSTEAQVLAILAIKQWLFIGLSNGQVVQFLGQQRQKIFFKNPSAVVQLIGINNKSLIATYQNGITMVWDLQTNQPTLEIQEDSANTVLIYMNDFYLFGDQGGTVRLVNFNEPRTSQEVIKKLKEKDVSVSALSELKNCKEILLVGYRDKTLTVWNWESSTPLTIINIEFVCLKMLSSQINDTRYIIAGLENGIIQLYQFDAQKTAKFAGQMQLNDNTLINMFKTEESNQFIVVGKSSKQIVEIDDNLCLSILTNPKLQQLGQLSHHTSCVYAISNVSYPFFASSSDDKTIKIFNINSHEVIQTLKGHQAYVKAVAVLQDGRHLISGSYDSSIKIWEIQTATCLNTMTGHTKPVLALAVVQHSDRICISGGEDACIKGWNWKLATCLWMVELGKNEVWSLCCVRASDIYAVLSGHKDGLVRVVNIGYKCEVTSVEKEIKVHKSFVNNIINLKDSIVATASSDNLICIVNWRQGIVVRVLKGHHDIVWGIELLDESTIVSSSTEGNLKLWNWKTGICLNTAYGSKGSIYTLLRIPHTRKILCGIASGDIQTWKVLKPKDTTLSKITR